MNNVRNIKKRTVKMKPTSGPKSNKPMSVAEAADVLQTVLQEKEKKKEQMRHVIETQECGINSLKKNRDTIIPRLKEVVGLYATVSRIENNATSLSDPATFRVMLSMFPEYDDNKYIDIVGKIIDPEFYDIAQSRFMMTKEQIFEQETGKCARDNEKDYEEFCQSEEIKYTDFQRNIIYLRSLMSDITNLVITATKTRNPQLAYLSYEISITDLETIDMVGNELMPGDPLTNNTPAIQVFCNGKATEIENLLNSTISREEILYLIDHFVI